MSKGSTATQNWLIQNPNHNRAELITITLTNGDVFHVLDGTNGNITYDGITFYSAQYGSWTRGPFENQASFRPESQRMTMEALLSKSGPDVVYYPGTTTTLLSCVNSGLFNAATVNIVELFWAENTRPPTSGGYWFTLTNGLIGSCTDTGQSKVNFEVFDYLYTFSSRPFPPHQIQTGCRNILGDAGCTIVNANITTTTQTLDSSSTSLYLNISVPSHQTSHTYSLGNLILVSGVLYFCTVGGLSGSSAPTFDATFGAVTFDNNATFQSMGSTAAGTNPAFQGFPLGHVTFLSGQNTGLLGTIKLMALSGSLLQIQLSRPMPLNVAGGDTVTLIMGCNKSLFTCNALFSNTIHYGGFPYVPNPETISGGG